MLPLHSVQGFGSRAQHDSLTQNDDHSTVINTGHLNESFLAVLQT